jgi:hypothetical protein
LASGKEALPGVESQTTGRGLLVAGKSFHAVSSSVGEFGGEASREAIGPHVASNNAETATQSALAMPNAEILHQLVRSRPIERLGYVHLGPLGAADPN